MEQPNGPARPRWDGNRILFEVIAGGERVPCAISRAAVQGLSERRCFKTPELLQCFAAARARIEKIALDKLGARPAGVCGTLNIWEDDIEDAAPPGAPAAKTAAETKPVATPPAIPPGEA